MKRDINIQESSSEFIHFFNLALQHPLSLGYDLRNEAFEIKMMNILVVSEVISLKISSGFFYKIVK